MVVAFDEVIDNSIRAGASVISFGLIDAGNGVVKGLVCKDNGVSGVLEFFRSGHVCPGCYLGMSCHIYGWLRPSNG